MRVSIDKRFLVILMLSGIRVCIAQTPAGQQPSGIKYHEVRDASNGMVQAISPIPTTWQVNDSPQAAVFMSGPGGIAVYATQTDTFAWSPDPFAQQSLMQGRQQVAPVLSLEQILEQSLVPAAQAQGNRLVRAYPIPEIEGFWARFGAGMAQTGSERQWRALGSDWTDGQGTSTFVSLVQGVTQNQQFIAWNPAKHQSGSAGGCV